MATLRTSVLGIEFENPFLLASAPPTALIESIEKAFALGWGGAVIKTITPDDLEMIEASPRYAVMREKNKVIGFQNIELLSHHTVKYWCDGIRYLKEKYPEKVVIASIMAPTEKTEWQKLVKILNDTPADAFELNFSCPHGMPEKNIGMAIGTSGEISSMITSWVKEVAKKPVFVKLSPNVTDIVQIAQTVEKAGADGLAAINTVQGFMGIDLETLEPNLNIDGYTTFGGCSGEIIRPVGLRCVAQIKQAVNLPIMGMGGISNWQDAAQYIAVGSDVVQVCTEVMINGYGIIDGLKKGLLNYLETKGMESLLDLKGKALEKITLHKSLNKNYSLKPVVYNDKCVACGKCAKICEESEHCALKLVDKKIKSDEEKCVGCSLCSIVCPQNAISMQQK